MKVFDDSVFQERPITKNGFDLVEIIQFLLGLLKGKIGYG